MAENMGMAGDVDDRQLVLFLGDRHILLEGFQHHFGRIAVFHERHVVDVGAERNGDDLLVAERQHIGQIVVEHVAVPAVAGLGEQARRLGARGAARARASPHLAPDAFSSSAVQRAMFLRSSSSESSAGIDVHRVGMRQHLVPGFRHRVDGLPAHARRSPR